MELPKHVTLCLQTLESAGFQAYAVGGCVRDELLGIEPHDFDLCTSAKPDEIKQHFHQYSLVLAGEKHGTVGVVVNGEVIEITTFRSEGNYSDHRHPQWVSFVNDVEEDLARRDFTINAMAFSPSRGLIDPFHGSNDLENRVLKTVGAPDKRFHEDALRILRGIRFSTRFDLVAETETLDAMIKFAPMLHEIAAERILGELNGFLKHAKAVDLLQYRRIIREVIPEIDACIGFDQHSVHHQYDVFTHIAYVVENVPEDYILRWAALLHDIGKPNTFTLDKEKQGHFYGHAQASEKMADTILTRLKMPTEEKNEVLMLIREHMNRLTAEKKLIRKRISQYGEDAVVRLLQLQQSDLRSKGTGCDDSNIYQDVSEMIEEILRDEGRITLKALAVSGKDLIENGINPGKQMGKILDQLLELVINEEIPNEKGILLRKALSLYEENIE